MLATSVIPMKHQKHLRVLCVFVASIRIFTRSNQGRASYLSNVQKTEPCSLFSGLYIKIGTVWSRLYITKVY